MLWTTLPGRETEHTIAVIKESNGPPTFLRRSSCPMYAPANRATLKRLTLLDIWLTAFSLRVLVEPTKMTVTTMVKSASRWQEILWHPNSDNYSASLWKICTNTSRKTSTLIARRPICTWLCVISRSLQASSLRSLRAIGAKTSTETFRRLE